MKKIYCIYCGKENKESDEKCINCEKLLNEKDHPWKDYLYDHIKSDFKDNVTDKTISLITNYIKSHMYGVFMSALIIATTVSGVVKVVNAEPIRKVESKPIIIEAQELSLDSELVGELYDIVSFNNDLILGEEGFYLGKYVDYNSFSNQNKLYLANHFKKKVTSSYTFTNCEDLKSYEDVYSMCIFDDNGTGSWFGPEYVEYMNLYKIDVKSFENAYKDFWGKDKEMPKENFDIKYSMGCEYSNENDDYLCHALMQGWPADQYEMTKLIKAEKLGNTIHLYDYFVYADYGEIEGTFKDRYKKEKISNIDYREIYFNDKEDMSIMSQGQIYKHTFKNNGNGTYYWVSSEPILKLDD